MIGRYRIENSKAENFQRSKRFVHQPTGLPPRARFKLGLLNGLAGVCGFLFVGYLGFSLAEKPREHEPTTNATSPSQTLMAGNKSSLKMTIISLSENRNTIKFHQKSSSPIVRELPLLNEPKVESKNFERWSATYPELVRTAKKLDIFRDPESGLVQIGSFSTLNVRSDQHQCETFREIFLEKLKGTEQSFNVIADTDFIYIARFCAQNGSLILSCRNGQMTAGTRKSRPDDKCS